MKKRIISIFLSVLMMLTLLGSFSFAADYSFAGGTGSEDDPFLIANATQLDNVRNYLGASFKMINDVTVGKRNMFTPIGTKETPFTGTFDGNGYSIKELHIGILAADTAYVGLFGFVDEGSIRNLTIASGNISGDVMDIEEHSASVGSIAGLVRGEGAVENCTNYATVWGRGVVGGVVGSSNADVVNCVNRGKVSSPDYTGGIIGLCNGPVFFCVNEARINESMQAHTGETVSGGIASIAMGGEIIGCANKNKVNGEWYAGGIVAHTLGNVTVSECYNVGDINATNLTDLETAYAEAGGIVGLCHSGTIKDCYNTASVRAYSENSDAAAGGIAGVCTLGEISTSYNIGKVTCEIGYWALAYYDAVAGAISGLRYLMPDFTCYYLNNVSRAYGSGEEFDEQKCTAAQLEKRSTFDSFDFDSVWTMSGNSLYPYPELKNVPMDSFIDVPIDAWYKTYVDYAVAAGIFGGKGGGKFEPSANITRGEFVQVLANISGVDTSNKNVSSAFSDVKSGQWYAPAVMWAYNNGIVSGKGAGKFEPNAKITREEMCVMLVNYTKNKGISLKSLRPKENFADDKKISSWAKDAVYKCYCANLVNGKGEGKFDPKGNALRAEASTVFTLFHKDYM